MKLTEKQKKFCDHYIKTGNATESAIKAGYSKKTAFTIGCENLKKPYIREYIEGRNEKISNSRIADMQEVKEFWTNFLRGENVDPKDRLKASEFIAKTNGAFLDRVEQTNIDIIIDIEDDRDD
jgi:phage terminase small subunit